MNPKFLHDKHVFVGTRKYQDPSGNFVASIRADFAAAALRGIRDAATTEALNPAARNARHSENPVGPVS